MSAIRAEKNKFVWKSKGIYAKISKYAMRDPVVSYAAKALYTLMCTYSIFGNDITVGNRTLCKDLKIGEKKLYRLLKELRTQGYIRIKVKPKGRFSRNNYEIVACPAKYHDMSLFDEKAASALALIRKSGLQSYAYGLTEQRVLRDPELHITAKAIYAYFCALSGDTGTAYPYVTEILRDLNIAESTYYIYIKQLVEKKYVLVMDYRNEDGTYGSNEYKLLGHPNSHKPSNYKKNTAAEKEKKQESKTTKPTGKQNKSFPKSDAQQKNQNQKSNNVNPSDVRPFSPQSFNSETQAEPCRNEPAKEKPDPEKDRTYKKNTLKTNNLKKNTLNQAGKNFEKKAKRPSGINQSAKSKKDDSIDKNKFKNISVNPDKIYQDLLKYKGIPVYYLKHKVVLEYIIQTAADNVENVTPTMPESQRAFFIKQSLMSAESLKPEENKLRKLFLKCLVDMLYDSGNANKRYSPEEIAGYINAHIKIDNGVVSFDNWLEKFEKSFMQSVSKPSVGHNIKNPYAYVKTSLWKFLATYTDYHFDFKASSENEIKSSQSDDLFEKLVKKSLNF